MSPTLRQRLAARHIVIPDGVRRRAGRMRKSISKTLHRDAEKVRRRAMQMEHQAEASLKGWFAKLKPEVIRIEHRAEDAARRLKGMLKA